MASAIPQFSLNTTTGTPDVTAEFQEVLERCRRESVIHEPPRDFILANRLLEWFRSKPTYDPDTTNAENLLREVLEVDDPPTFIDEMLDDLDTGNGCWLKVFTILLLLHKPGYIVSFWRRRIADQRLPNLSEREIHTLLSDIQECDLQENELKEFATSFVEMQYQLCTPTPLDSKRGGRVGPLAILPFCKVDPIKVERDGEVKAGETRKIYQIEVPRECIPQSIVNDIGRPYTKDGELYHEFALKILRNHEDYKQETRAYQAMSQRKGIVQCLGFWEFQRPNRKLEYHLLLEYGHFDLDEYFQTFPPQSLPGDTIRFWKDLSSIAVALETIHTLKFKIRGKPGAPEIWYGWHGDLKPENIIFCKGGWKIADPGYAQFKKGQDKLPEDENRLPVTMLRGGTSTYGPPEGATTPKQPVTQRFDVWSLACVFSEAATWLLLGQRGVEQYRFVRITTQHLRRNSTSAELRGDDCFHAQGSISPAVIEWHKYLRNSLRSGDTVTGAILALVEKSMMVVSASKRISANRLVRDLNDIITKAEKDESRNKYEPPEYFAIAFREEQKKASEEWSNPTAQLEVRKSNRYKSTRYAQGNLPPGSDLLSYDQHVPFESDNLSKASTLQLKTGLFGSDRIEPESLSAYGLGASDTRMHLSPSPYGEPENSDRFDYWDALSLLEKQGWVHRGTLERPPSSDDTSNPAVDSSILTQPVDNATRLTDSTGLVRHAKPQKSHQKQKRNRSSISQLFKRPSKISAATIASNNSPVAPQAELKASVNSAGSSNAVNSKYKNTDFDSFFDKRDIVFLLDNGSTMAEHWPRVRELMAVLVALLHGQDDNGMELYFTSSRKPHGPMTEPREFVDIINKMRPKQGGHPLIQPKNKDEANADDIRIVLFDVILSLVGYADYERKLTLIILTDGIWKGIIKSKRSVANMFVNCITRWEDKEKLKKLMDKRELSIQFVQFGSDENASVEFEYMDNRLAMTDGTRLPDIIDVEPESGNVKKMILGSLSDEWDGEARTVASDDSQYRAGHSDRLGSLPGTIGNSSAQTQHAYFAHAAGQIVDHDQTGSAGFVSTYNPTMDVNALGAQFKQPRDPIHSMPSPWRMPRQEPSPDR